MQVFFNPKADMGKRDYALSSSHDIQGVKKKYANIIGLAHSIDIISLVGNHPI